MIDKLIKRFYKPCTCYDDDARLMGYDWREALGRALRCKERGRIH